MAKWTSKSYRLKEGHGWKTKQGHKIFIADNGAVRFDIPKDWVPVPAKTSFQLYNRQPPDDDCRLEVSIFYLAPGIDWSELSLRSALEEVVRTSMRDAFAFGEVVEIKRPDLEVAWMETRYPDPTEGRAARTRTCLARRGTIQPLITMDLWEDDVERFAPVWDEVIRSLQLGVWIKDPTHRGLN